MKKSVIIIALLILIAMLCSCTCDIVRSGGVVVRATPGRSAEKTDYEKQYPDKEIVYITKNGTKYHKEDCSYLSSSKIPVTLEQAISQGLEPCSKCFPPD